MYKGCSRIRWNTFGRNKGNQAQRQKDKVMNKALSIPHIAKEIAWHLTGKELFQLRLVSWQFYAVSKENLERIHKREHDIIGSLSMRMLMKIDDFVNNYCRLSQEPLLHGIYDDFVRTRKTKMMTMFPKSCVQYFEGRGYLSSVAITGVPWRYPKGNSFDRDGSDRIHAYRWNYLRWFLHGGYLYAFLEHLDRSKNDPIRS